MKRKKLFLTWSWMMSLTLVAAIIVAWLGWFKILWQYDDTKICFVILALFTRQAIRGGLLAGRVDSLVEQAGVADPKRSEKLTEAEISFDKGWTDHDDCQYLGYLGTLAGFIIVLIGGFPSLMSGGENAIMQFLPKMAVGFGTAVLTSIVGVVCSMLLKRQLKPIEYEIARLKEKLKVPS